MKWLIVAGGTGGHIFPGIAVAETLIKEGKEVLFVSGTRKIEREILANYSFPKEVIDVEGFIGKDFPAKVKSSVKMAKSILKARKILKDFVPDVIFATGGYVSIPIVLVGRFYGKVIGLHEQNIEPGVANKLLSRLVDKIFVSIESSKKYFPEHKVVFSGNPVRKELRSVIEKRKKKTHKGILFMGGSQGARFINKLALNIVPKLIKEIDDLFVIHQTGFAKEREIKEFYEKELSEHEKERLYVKAFIKDMVWAYSQVDLVVGRAGATTLAELFATKTPAIFIPFPYATHNHQEKNAREVSEKGGAFCIVEKHADPEKIYKLILELFSQPNKLKEMSEIMGSFYKEDAEKIIIQQLEACVC